MSKNILEYNFIQQLQMLPFVDEIWLFGSRARGDNTEQADIDLAIICPTANNRNWDSIMEIIDQADTLLKIDCIRFDKQQISPELYHNILNEKQVIYAKNQN
jgi:predicted nucleotidyltransferase